MKTLFGKKQGEELVLRIQSLRGSDGAGDMNAPIGTNEPDEETLKK